MDINSLYWEGEFIAFMMDYLGLIPRDLNELRWGRGRHHELVSGIQILRAHLIQIYIMVHLQKTLVFGSKIFGATCGEFC